MNPDGGCGKRSEPIRISLLVASWAGHMPRALRSCDFRHTFGGMTWSPFHPVAVRDCVGGLNIRSDVIPVDDEMKQHRHSTQYTMNWLVYPKLKINQNKYKMKRAGLYILRHLVSRDVMDSCDTNGGPLSIMQ